MSLVGEVLLWGRACATKNITPHLHVRTLNEVPLGWLKGRGVRLVLLDVDQTLTGYHGESIDGRVKAAVDRLKEEFPVYLVSNAPNERLRQLPRLFGIPVVLEGRGKPYPDRLYWAMGEVGAKPRETVIIGDSVFMDVYAARNAGAYAVLVDPLAPKTDPFAIKMARGIERLLLA